MGSECHFIRSGSPRTLSASFLSRVDRCPTRSQPFPDDPGDPSDTYDSLDGAGSGTGTPGQHDESRRPPTCSTPLGTTEGVGDRVGWEGVRR